MAEKEKSGKDKLFCKKTLHISKGILYQVSKNVNSKTKKTLTYSNHRIKERVKPE